MRQQPCTPDQSQSEVPQTSQGERCGRQAGRCVPHACTKGPCPAQASPPSAAETCVDMPLCEEASPPLSSSPFAAIFTRSRARTASTNAQFGWQLQGGRQGWWGMAILFRDCSSSRHRAPAQGSVSRPAVDRLCPPRQRSRGRRLERALQGHFDRQQLPPACTGCEVGVGEGDVRGAWPAVRGRCSHA